MRGGKISRTQLMALLWAGTLAPAAELLPALLLPSAGKGAWLSMLAAFPLVWLIGMLLGGPAEGRGLARAMRDGFGPVFGRLLLLIYMVWGGLLLALRLRLWGERLMNSGGRDGSLWFFLLVMTALILWVGIGGLSAFARAGQLFLTALLVTAGVVLGLSLFQMRPERLLPMWWSDGVSVLKGALPAAGVLGWTLFGGFLTGSMADQGEQKGWHWLSWSLGGCVLLAAAQAIILGSLGAELSGTLDSPFFALAKSVGVEGAFQRVEGLVAALWSFSDLVQAGVLVFALRAIGTQLGVKKEWERWFAALAVVCAGGLALFLGKNAGLWNKTLIPWGNLILSLGGAVLLWAINAACGKKSGKKHILWSKKDKKPKI